MEIYNGIRSADEEIYLNESNYGAPKFIFQLIGDYIQESGVGADSWLLDLGCATGEFIYYILDRFSNVSAVGIDISEKMLLRAEKMNPQSQFILGSVEDAEHFEKRKFNFVTSAGVLAIMDDPEAFITNAVSVTAPGGTVIISSLFNPDPIDTLVRYRRSTKEGAEWESGWNIWSYETIGKILNGLNIDLTWDWRPWNPPDAIIKGDDPMRTWTINTSEKENQRVNGACLLVHGCILHIRVD